MSKEKSIFDAQLELLRELRADANLHELEAVQIISPGYTHLGNLVQAPDKPCFCIMDRYEVVKYFAFLHNLVPQLLEKLEKKKDVEAPPTQ